MDYMVKKWRHYEKLAMDFEMETHSAKLGLQKANAEIGRLHDGLGVMLAAFAPVAFSIAEVEAVDIARAALKASARFQCAQQTPP